MMFKQFLMFLGVLVLLAGGVLGLGYYLGWFHVTTDGTGHDANATIAVDRDKIHKDEEKAKETMHGAGHAAKEKPVAPTGAAKEESPRP
jgi:hypothetical protein